MKNQSANYATCLALPCLALVHNSTTDFLFPFKKFRKQQKHRRSIILHKAINYFCLFIIPGDER